jgi:CubicO group peptidase (beta-lactamase class C family)
MTQDRYEELEDLLRSAVGSPDTVGAPAVQIAARHRGQVVVDRAYGWMNPETRDTAVTEETRFDLASLTKLFVVTTFMTLMEVGKVGLDQSVATVLPELDEVRPIQPYEDPQGSDAWITLCDGGTVDAGQVTFRHLLTHTSGLPAWRPLFRQPSAEAARQMALTTFFAYPTGTRVVYSDIGLILLGLAIERLTDRPLDDAVQAAVIRPLGLRRTGYRPLDAPDKDDDLAHIAPTEFCRWRQRRIVGEVHDENAYRLNGVAGHAGIFSTARDVAAFGQSFLNLCSPTAAETDVPTRLAAETVAEMRRLQTPGLNIPRGLGFALWSPDPEASSHPFSESVFGHTGFTGTSLWIDPEREVVVALLTNEVYNGREDRQIAPLRVAVHRSLLRVIDSL